MELLTKDTLCFLSLGLIFFRVSEIGESWFVDFSCFHCLNAIFSSTFLCLPVVDMFDSALLLAHSRPVPIHTYDSIDEWVSFFRSRFCHSCNQCRNHWNKQREAECEWMKNRKNKTTNYTKKKKQFEENTHYKSAKRLKWWMHSNQCSAAKK